MFYYPGEEIEVAKYWIKVTTNSSKYKAVYLTEKASKKNENQKHCRNNPKLLGNTDLYSELIVHNTQRRKCNFNLYHKKTKQY